MDHSRVPDWSESPSLNYLAHVRRNDDGSFENHDLENHLRGVGDPEIEGLR